MGALTSANVSVRSRVKSAVWTYTRMVTFTLHEGVGFANALRRSILQDVESWAPEQCVVKRNTSCATDEYIAHRIGMIPFRKVGNGTTMELRARGPCRVFTDRFTGPAFEAVQKEIEVMRLGEGQELDVQVLFEKHPAHKHARYSQCAGVAISAQADGSTRVSFTCNDGREPTEVLRQALEKLDERVQRALHQLANDPEKAPQSFS